MALTRSDPLLLLLLLAFASLTASGATIVQENCGRTLYPQLCISYLSQMPESGSADAHHLAELAIRAAAQVGTKTSTYISKVLNSALNDSMWQQCLNDCSESYINAVAELDDSTGAMDEFAYADVNKFVNAAIGDTQTCEEACRNSAFGEKATLLKMNEEFGNLCKVILVLVNILPK
ncbi:pectinesterase 1-like [Canna indica]|uniref:Pectinesterase 1-like n=1 Tax=Canna indica TaxID=4628 RepID=A0AAQ3L5D3_9LILI|nr:pectinesterase 1-like [Canna indica]